MRLRKTGDEAEVPQAAGYEDIQEKQVEDDFFIDLL